MLQGAITKKTKYMKDPQSGKFTAGSLVAVEPDKVNMSILDEVKKGKPKLYERFRASQAYEELKQAERKPLIVLLEYNREVVPEKKVIVASKKAAKDKINVALVGAGAFAKGMHLPHLQNLNKLFSIHAVVDKNGSNAKSVAHQYKASYAATDWQDVVRDTDVDLIIVTTRHHLHVPIAKEAAKNGKAVLVEKPMATNLKDLKSLVEILEETKVPYMVGFNRRFSRFAQRIKEIVKERVNPMIINYRMNAGYIPQDHWVHSEEGGGRNIGEACHIYDLFNYFTDSKAESISAFSINPKTKQYARNDNFIATVQYKDGSVCNLIYTALGSQDVPKEQMEIYFDGKIVSLDNYKEMKIFGASLKGIQKKVQDKGHYEELVQFAKSIREGEGYPIPLWQLVQATEISFEVERHLIA